MSFRKIIQQEVARRGWSGYRLGQESGIPIRTVQQYLAGRADMTGEKLAMLCEALGLGIRPTGRRKGKVN